MSKQTRCQNRNVKKPKTLQKEKIIPKSKLKKNASEIEGQPSKLSLSARLSRIDGIRPFTIAALAVLFGFFNSYHQATMFENDRHFSHLSSLEREMTFRTEMGLYYFYYKRITESPSLLAGIQQIMNDNLTEYPSTINTLERFTLYPEVLLAASYRNIQSAADFFNVSVKECWQILRGEDLPPIESCEGVGDPAYFYVTSVFLLNGLVGSLLFLFGAILSNSISGGILAAVCFFFNHGECTRVQWTPPLRESFGYPFFLLQMMLVTLSLKCRKPSFSHSVIIAVPTLLFMLSWQFAQFALLTQLLALFALHIVGLIPLDTYKHILKGHLINLVFAIIFLFGNKMLIASFYTSTLLVSFVIVSKDNLIRRINQPILIMLLKGITLVLGCLFLKLVFTAVFDVKDDAHIWSLLKSKFTSYQDFHTMLYTCAVEFDFLPIETSIELLKTLVLPSASLVVVVILYLIFYKPKNLELYCHADETLSLVLMIIHSWPSIRLHQEGKEIPKPKFISVLYNILQCLAFFIMAVLIMRLKLFFTPHLCLLVSLVMSGRFFRFLDVNSTRLFILVGLLGAMSIQGVTNIKQQRDIIGEFSNPELEELITWINATLPEDAVFAGPMPTMANILLSTRRPIINHPHYENADLRARTRKVYQIFSRKSVADVYNTLLDLKVDYVLLERGWCFGKRREGCAMVDLWDIEDPENRDKESLCQKVIRNPYPFRKTFRNSIYTVLAL